MTPARVQRRRGVKGWRKPEGAVYVGRISDTKPGKWGNPFDWRVYGRAEAVRLHREWFLPQPGLVALARAELVGKTLMCYCPVDQQCHADTLLEVANGGAR